MGTEYSQSTLGKHGFPFGKSCSSAGPGESLGLSDSTVLLDSFVPLKGLFVSHEYREHKGRDERPLAHCPLPILRCCSSSDSDIFSVPDIFFLAKMRQSPYHCVSRSVGRFFGRSIGPLVRRSAC